MTWYWLASPSLDVARYIIFAATLHITGTVPQLDGGTAYSYALTPWVQVGSATTLSWADNTPNPALDEVQLLDFEAEDYAGNVSQRGE